MSQEIKTISLDGTNCYLVKTDSGYILIDTNFPFQRNKLEETLEREGCKPGNLKLIVITHGDIDETDVIHLTVKGDEEAFKRKMTRVILSSNVWLEQFAIEASDLESVFMKLVGEGEEKQEDNRIGKKPFWRFWR